MGWHQVSWETAFWHLLTHQATSLQRHSVLFYGAEAWPLSKTLTLRVHSFEFHALQSVQYSRRSSGPVLCLMWISAGGPANRTSSAPSLSAVFARSRPATTWWQPYQSHLPVPPTICKLETTFVAVHAADGRTSSAKTSSRSIWC